MIRAVWEQLRCPLCAGALTPSSDALRCPSGHAFDLARQGYANLLVGRSPAGAETPDMVAARANLLAAGHLDPVIEAVAHRAAEQTAAQRVEQGGEHGVEHDVAQRVERGVAQSGAERSSETTHPGLVVDIGAGTGHYLAAVLDRLPGHQGVALDVAKAAVRRAARAHPRAAAAVCDVWRGIPLADACADLVLDVFAPRNGAEFRRVLRPTGSLLLVTPRPDHLAELVGPLGLIRVDPSKDARLDRSLGRYLTLVDERVFAYELALSRAEVAQFILMGPNAWHAKPAALTARLADWVEPVRVTATVSLRTYRPGR